MMRAIDLQERYPYPVMYVTGRMVKAIAKELGTTATQTKEGHPVVDEEMYCMTEDGIFWVETE